MTGSLQAGFHSGALIGTQPPEPAAARGIAIRLFLTCWLVYCLHLTTNIVREIYPALSLGDHFSFRVDEYAGMHSDIFELPGRGWHINSNPGASMLAAIPYAMFQPVVSVAVNQVNERRRASGADPPAYDSPWPMARAFYEEAWRRGLDIKFGLAAVLSQTLMMAPISALGVTAMFWFLRRVTGSNEGALWLALLYAFGTPVFFRAAYLNHNMMAGHAAFLGFLMLWNPGPCFGWSMRTRTVLAGMAGGLCVLLDYSGVVLLAGLLLYSLLQANAEYGAARRGLWYSVGAACPIGLLFLYQWRSFGHPLFPAQYWMPRVTGSNLGFHGFSGPLPDQLLANLIDYRFGLFTSCVLLILAFASPWVRWRWNSFRAREKAFFALLTVAVWLFSSSVAYSRLQFNTGVRYMTAALPFLFVLTVPVLLRISARAAWLIGVAAVAQTWAMAMYRDVEQGWGVLDPVIKMVTQGFTLPVLTLASRLGLTSGGASSISPLPLFLIAGAVLFGVWSPRLSRKMIKEDFSPWN